MGTGVTYQNTTPHTIYDELVSKFKADGIKVFVNGVPDSGSASLKKLEPWTVGNIITKFGLINVELNDDELKLISNLNDAIMTLNNEGSTETTFQKSKHLRYNFFDVGRFNAVDTSSTLCLFGVPDSTDEGSLNTFTRNNRPDAAHRLFPLLTEFKKMKEKDGFTVLKQSLNRSYIAATLNGTYKHTVCFTVDEHEQCWLIVSTSNIDEISVAGKAKSWLTLDVIKYNRADFGKLWLLFGGQDDSFYYTRDAAAINAVLGAFNLDREYCWVQPLSKSSSYVYKVTVGCKEKKQISTADPSFIIKLNYNEIRALYELRALTAIGNYD